MQIKLEKFTSSDFPLFFQLVGDERVMAMITERAFGREEAIREFEIRLEKNKLHNSFGFFKILNTADNSFVGFAKLELENIDDDEVEIGYMLLPAFWGMGIASKASEILLDIVKANPEIKRVTAIIDPANLPSRKVLTKNGFVHQEFRDYDGLPGEILELSLK